MPSVRPKRAVYGVYNRHGYQVLMVLDGRTTDQYTAGNHQQDSQASALPGSPEALSLRRIRSFCIKTTREIAGEKGAAYEGVGRCEDEEDGHA